MLNRPGYRTCAATIAAGLSLPGAAALAQSVSDYHLPTAPQSSTPRPAGPVDSDAPIIVPVRPEPTPGTPRPSQSPGAAPVSTPQPQADRPQAAEPRPAPARAALPGSGPVQAPRRQSPGQALPAPALPTDAASQPQIAPDASSDAAPQGQDLPPLLPMPESLRSFDPAALAARIWPWLAGLVAALAALWLANLWLKRREAREPEIDFERPLVTAAVPLEEPETEVPPIPPVVAMEPDQPLGVAVSANRLSATLLNTTLAYQIVLTNRSSAPIGPITVRGDMIAAHSTASVEQQLGLDGAELDLRHELPALAAGEAATFKGEIRLPLAMITPIMAGEASLFIPLARFRIAAEQAVGPALFIARTLVVGEPPQSADAGLRPFRLDLGPRVYSKIAQREVMATA